MTHSIDIHRVPATNLEMNVVYGCNLKCEYCTHLGRFMKGSVSLDDLLLWYRSWNQKIHPENVRIMGGEPLLHPHLETILYETRNHWRDSRVELVTNGLLLPKMRPSVFSALKKTGADVTVSKHFNDPHYNLMFELGLNVLQEHGIKPQITWSHRNWMKCYRMDSRGRTRPYQSRPSKAWEICYVQNICTTLLDNCLYRCPQLGCYAHAVKQGYVSDDWKTVLDYTPLPPSCTHAELEAFMQGGACEQCSICPEKFEYANLYEKLNLFGLPGTRNLFCGDIRNE